MSSWAGCITQRPLRAPYRRSSTVCRKSCCCLAAILLLPCCYLAATLLSALLHGVPETPTCTHTYIHTYVHAYVQGLPKPSTLPRQEPWCKQKSPSDTSLPFSLSSLPHAEGSAFDLCLAEVARELNSCPEFVGEAEGGEDGQLWELMERVCGAVVEAMEWCVVGEPMGQIERWVLV